MRRLLLLALVTSLIALSLPGFARETLPAKVFELGEDERVRRFARAPVESALKGCLILWTSEGDLENAPGELRLLCHESGTLASRTLASVDDSLRDMRVATGPEGELQLIIAREKQVDLRVLKSRQGDLSPARSLLAGEGFGHTALRLLPDLDSDDTSDLLLSTWSGVAAFRRGPAGYESFGDRALPPRVEMSPQGPGMTVSGWRLLESSEGTSVWTEPLTREGSRLSLWKVPVAPDGLGEPCEAWIATPEPVEVENSTIARIGEREFLVAFTRPADKLSLLGEGSLLVAEPACDPTRRGKAPLLVAKTSYAPWFEPHIMADRDVTGDGLVDIALIGLSGKLNINAEIRVHEGLPGGGWKSRPVRWEEDSEVISLRLNSDFDGDGFEDIALKDNDRVKIYRGRAPREGKVPLESRDAYRVDVPEGWTLRQLFPLALDADGRNLLLLDLRDEDDNLKRALGVVAIPLATN